MMVQAVVLSEKVNGSTDPREIARSSNGISGEPVVGGDGTY